MVPSSVHLQRNTLPHLHQLSWTSSVHGYLNHHLLIKTSQLGDLSCPKTSLILALASLTAPGTTAQYLTPKIISRWLRQLWIKKILHNQFHHKFAAACKIHQSESEPFISDTDILPFIQHHADAFFSHSFDLTIAAHQPFRLQLFHSLLSIAYDPDTNIASLLQDGIPSGAFSKTQPVGLWEPNTKTQDDYPELRLCQDNWTSANHNPDITKQLIQKELDDGFIEEIPDIKTAEERWPKGIALGKLGVVHADNLDPRLVATYRKDKDSQTSDIFRSSFLFVFCYRKSAKEHQLISKQLTKGCFREDERGSLLFKFNDRIFAYRSAHFGAKTVHLLSAWHWGRVSGALLRLLHVFLYFRHAAWVYVDDFFSSFQDPLLQSSLQ